MNAIDRINALQARDQNLADLLKLIDDAMLAEIEKRPYQIGPIHKQACKLKRPAAQPDGIEL